MSNYDLSRYCGLLYGTIDISRAHNLKMRQPIGSGVVYDFLRLRVSVVIRFMIFIEYSIDNDVRPIPIVSLSSLERLRVAGFIGRVSFRNLEGLKRLEVTSRILNELK